MAIVKKISELTAKGSNIGANDLVIVGVSNGTDYDLKSVTGNQLVGAAVAQTITSGVTTTAPSQDAVKTALDLKVDKVVGSRLITSAEGTSISDIANKAPLASPTFTGTVVLPSATSIGNVSATEIDYLDGVASNVQNQLNNKANLNTLITPGTATKVTYDAKGMILSGANITTSDVSGLGSLATQSGTFSGTSSGTNTGDQDISGKANIDSPVFTTNITTPTVIVSGEIASTIAHFDANKNVKSLGLGGYPSLTELSHVKGLTSAIQTQINSKASQDARVQTVTSSATVTPISTNDLVIITAQAAGLTLANPTGTFTEGQALMIRIKDNGTARTIAFDTNYRAIGVTLPTTTVISKTLYLGIIYNSTDSKWDVVGTPQQA